MTDVLDRQTRSRTMSHIKGKNTRPEMIVRRYLHSHGFRYGLHNARLPGKPDLVMPKYGAVIFIHGCFWHQHAGCRFASIPESNVAFWSKKLDRNVQRDAAHRADLKRKGWRILIIWGCALRNKAQLAENLPKIVEWLRSTSRYAEIEGGKTGRTAAVDDGLQAKQTPSDASENKKAGEQFSPASVMQLPGP